MALPWAWSMSFRERCAYFHSREVSTTAHTSAMVWSAAPSAPLRLRREHHGRCAGAGAARAIQRPGAARGLVVAGRGLRAGARSWCAATLAIWWARSRETRTTSYRVLGDVAGIRLDLGDADVEIDGGATAVEVRRVDRFAFGRPPTRRRTVEDGTLTIVSRCPDQVLGSCRALLPARPCPTTSRSTVETSQRHRQPRAACARRSRITTGSGAIAATGFCGFPLRATLRHRRRRALARVLGRPARAALAQPATCARSSRPAATRSTPRATRARSASAGSRTSTTRRSRSRR